MTENLQVLLADDSEVVRRRLGTMITEIPGVELVGEAADVADALEAIERLQPDLVIVDLHMPGNGLRLVEIVGRRKVKPTIVVLTNYPYEQYRDRCLTAGAEFFFDKATELDSVVEVLSDLANPVEPRAPHYGI
ncbi:MAG TPA: response regulator transcription factor [Anaerolineales bacterium]|nr:response regulator transcription factor [Anaerolineales bacterium]